MDSTQICCSELELGQSQLGQDCTLELQDQTTSSTSSQESLMETMSGKLKIPPPNGLPGLVRMLEDASTHQEGTPCTRAAPFTRVVFVG